MSLAGTAIRFIEATTIPAGTPGGIYRLTIAAQPTGNYPALGEPIATLLAAVPGSLAKVATGVRPSNVLINDDLGHLWQFDASGGTMGCLRNYTAIGATPTEHSTGAYGGNEATAVLQITFEFPQSGDMSR
jgi:hypothetical protein